MARQVRKRPLTTMKPLIRVHSFRCGMADGPYCVGETPEAAFADWDRRYGKGYSPYTSMNDRGWSYFKDGLYGQGKTKSGARNNWNAQMKRKKEEEQQLTKIHLKAKVNAGPWIALERS